MTLYLKICMQLNQLIKHYTEQLAADRNDFFQNYLDSLDSNIYKKLKEKIPNYSSTHTIIISPLCFPPSKKDLSE